MYQNPIYICIFWYSKICWFLIRLPLPHEWAAPKKPILNRVKKVDRNLLKDWTIKVNPFLTEIKSGNITETNRLIRPYVIFVGKKVSLKTNKRRGNAVNKTWWKRRIKQSIQELRKHINILERKKRGEIKQKEKYKVIEHKYRVKKKGSDVVLE